jgi:hypothetical protein
VAVSLAAFALLGIVGPLLVWRASRSSRNVALARLDKGLASNGGFVTTGIRFWRGVYLFRRVRAPDLSASPQLADDWRPRWDSGIILSPRCSAGWVQFGAAIRAYGLQYTTGDVLQYTNDFAHLGVSPTWMFIFGLVGRFGLRTRHHDGRWLKAQRF